jgi:hypothetical protein
MKIKKIVLALLIVITPFVNSCKRKHAAVANEAEAKQERIDEDNASKVEQLNHDYPKIPDERILDDGDGTPIYAELKKRYKDELTSLKSEIEATGAKFVVVIITNESGSGLQAPNRYGIPYIKSICEQMGQECIDFTSWVASQDPRVITQVPRDGHWSKKGAIFIADHLEPIIKKYYDNTSKVTYKDAERSATFGDLAQNDDEILDGGKDMPYHVKANSQGVRMDHDIKFPKTKKHILMMGDSGFYCPYLDNEFTISGVLQQRFPGAEIMNTGIIAYTMDDYLTLWREKAKYSEPDLVILQTNGGDITDLFFTQRNHLSRTHKPYNPTPVEAKFYKDTYQR